MTESVNVIDVPKGGISLDLGCGSSFKADYGHIGVDIAPLEKMFPEGAPSDYDTYEQVDLFKFPWPWEDDSVSLVWSSHFVEHIPHYRPEFEGVDGWWLFFGELYRVMMNGGKAEITHPFSRSDRAFWDPTHVRFIHYQTWFYLNRKHREDLGINHYDMPDVNFKVELIDAKGQPKLLQSRSGDALDFAHQFYFNATEDLYVVLEVEK